MFAVTDLFALIYLQRENFQMEGPTRVMKQLQALWQILELSDKELFAHLSKIGAESLHFAFRMLLVLFRRELSFNEALSMWEVRATTFFQPPTPTTHKNPTDCLNVLFVRQNNFIISKLVPSFVPTNLVPSLVNKIIYGTLIWKRN